MTKDVILVKKLIPSGYRITSQKYHTSTLPVVGDVEGFGECLPAKQFLLPGFLSVDSEKNQGLAGIRCLKSNGVQLRADFSMTICPYAGGSVTVNVVRQNLRKIFYPNFFFRQESVGLCT